MEGKNDQFKGRIQHPLANGRHDMATVNPKQQTRSHGGDPRFLARLQRQMGSCHMAKQDPHFWEHASEVRGRTSPTTPQNKHPTLNSGRAVRKAATLTVRTLVALKLSKENERI